MRPLTIERMPAEQRYQLDKLTQMRALICAKPATGLTPEQRASIALKQKLDLFDKVQANRAAA
jgi:hypothetical protein